MHLLGMLFGLPFFTPAKYRSGMTVLMALCSMAASAVWLLAPFVLWHSLGAGWVALWLIPTTSAIFGLMHLNKMITGHG